MPPVKAAKMTRTRTRTWTRTVLLRMRIRSQYAIATGIVPHVQTATRDGWKKFKLDEHPKWVIHPNLVSFFQLNYCVLIYNTSLIQ